MMKVMKIILIKKIAVVASGRVETETPVSQNKSEDWSDQPSSYPQNPGMEVVVFAREGRTSSLSAIKGLYKEFSC